MSRGYVIQAINNDTTDYVACAKTLADSIHRVMPHSPITLMTTSDIVDSRFDHIIKIVDVDPTQWKLANDWQVYSLSPYQHTIKLEADMYIPRKIDWWWDVLSTRSMNICTTIRDFRGNISTEQFYRRTFVESNLANTYNAITYFSKSAVAEEFYQLVRDIFENWLEYRELLKYSSEGRATTDVVYAIAAKIIGYEHCTMPHFTDFSMVHMKQHINGLLSARWHDELLYEIQPDRLRFNTHTQMYPVHYHTKSFQKIIDGELAEYD